MKLDFAGCRCSISFVISHAAKPRALRASSIGYPSDFIFRWFGSQIFRSLRSDWGRCMGLGGKVVGVSRDLPAMFGIRWNSVPKVSAGWSNPVRSLHASCIVDVLRSRGGVLHRFAVLRPRALGFARIFLHSRDERRGKRGGLQLRCFVIRGSGIASRIV